jgi:hypothetical protein
MARSYFYNQNGKYFDIIEKKLPKESLYRVLKIVYVPGVALQLTDCCEAERYDVYEKLFIEAGIPERTIKNTGEPKSHMGEPRSRGWGITFEEPEHIALALDALTKFNIFEENDDNKKSFVSLAQYRDEIIVKHNAYGRSDIFESLISKLQLHTNDVAMIFKTALDSYNNITESRITFFGFFNRRLENRNEFIDKITKAFDDATNPVSKSLNKTEFFLKIYEIRQEVYNDHVKNSFFAKCKLTDSTLVKSLDSALSECVKAKYVTREELNSLSIQVTSKRNAIFSPKI